MVWKQGGWQLSRRQGSSSRQRHCLWLKAVKMDGLSSCFTCQRPIAVANLSSQDELHPIIPSSQASKPTQEKFQLCDRKLDVYFVTELRQLEERGRTRSKPSSSSRPSNCFKLFKIGNRLPRLVAALKHFSRLQLFLLTKKAQVGPLSVNSGSARHQTFNMRRPVPPRRM